MNDSISKTFLDGLVEQGYLFPKQDDRQRQQGASLKEAYLAKAKISIGTKFQYNGIEYEVIQYEFQRCITEIEGREFYLLELLERDLLNPFRLIAKASHGLYSLVPAYIEQDKLLEFLATPE